VDILVLLDLIHDKSVHALTLFRDNQMPKVIENSFYSLFLSFAINGTITRQ
jgi:hypothetical protein